MPAVTLTTSPKTAVNESTMSGLRHGMRRGWGARGTEELICFDIIATTGIPFQ